MTEGAIIARIVRTFWQGDRKFIELERICRTETPDEAQVEAKTARKPVPRRDPVSEERD